MKDKSIYRIHADICQMLTHPLRLEIIDNLRDGEKSVSELVEALEAPQGTVSRHLSAMRTKGIVTARRDGQHVFYHLSSVRVVAAYDQMHQFAMEHLALQSEMLTAKA